MEKQNVWGNVLVAAVSAGAAWYGSQHGWGFWSYAAAWFSGFMFALSGHKYKEEWRRAKKRANLK